jgi:hypothetical protein
VVKLSLILDGRPTLTCTGQLVDVEIADMAEDIKRRGVIENRAFKYGFVSALAAAAIGWFQFSNLFLSASIFLGTYILVAIASIILKEGLIPLPLMTDDG